MLGEDSESHEGIGKMNMPRGDVPLDFEPPAQNRKYRPQFKNVNMLRFCPGE